MRKHADITSIIFFNIALPHLYSLFARSVGNKRRRAYRSISVSISRRNRCVGLIEWPTGRRVFDRRKGCCGNRGGVRHTGNCPTGNPINGRARLSAAPYRVAPRYVRDASVWWSEPALRGAWRGLTCFGSRCSRGCRESCSYISHNYPSICEQPHTKTIRKPRLLPLDSAVFSGSKLPDRSRDPGIPRMLNALRVLFGNRANAWVYDPVRTREMLDSIYCSRTSRNCKRCSKMELPAYHLRDYEFSVFKAVHSFVIVRKNTWIEYNM